MIDYTHDNHGLMGWIFDLMMILLGTKFDICALRIESIVHRARL